MLLSVLAGHRRYAHITALRGDLVNPPLLGMCRVLSEDSVRRNLGKVDCGAVGHTGKVVPDPQRSAPILPARAATRTTPPTQSGLRRNLRSLEVPAAVMKAGATAGL